MSRIVISPPNAILFVYDPTNEEASTPPYVDGELIAATKMCVSVGTQSYVDGDTDISLTWADREPPNLSCAFRGPIAVPGGKVTVGTAELQQLLNIDVPKGMVDVSIWVDDRRNPTQVIVNVHAKMSNQNLANG